MHTYVYTRALSICIGARPSLGLVLAYGWAFIRLESSWLCVHLVVSHLSLKLVSLTIADQTKETEGQNPCSAVCKLQMDAQRIPDAKTSQGTHRK